MTVNQKMSKKIHLALFFAHSLIVILWYIDLVFFASGFSTFFLILFAIYYTGYGVRFFLKKCEVLSFFSILLPCSLIFLSFTLPICAIFLGNASTWQSMDQKMNDVSFFYARMQYSLRKTEFQRDIEREKKSNPKVIAMQWLPMSGREGPLYIYSEKKLPTNQSVHHTEYIARRPQGTTYAVETPPENEKPYYPDGGYFNDCYGYMRALDKNFYVFFNGACY